MTKIRSRTSVVVLAGLVIAAAGAVVLTLTAPTGAEADRGDSGAKPTPTPSDTSSPGTVVGATFPALTLVSLDGRPLTTRVRPDLPADTRMMVVVWDSSCDCAELFGLANAIASSGDPALMVVGISYDSDLAQAAQTSIASGLSFPSALDRNGVVADALGVQVPQVIVLDARGEILAHFTKTPTEAELEAALR